MVKLGNVNRLCVIDLNGWVGGRGKEDITVVAE